MSVETRVIILRPKLIAPFTVPAVKPNNLNALNEQFSKKIFIVYRFQVKLFSLYHDYEWKVKCDAGHAKIRSSSAQLLVAIDIAHGSTTLNFREYSLGIRMASLFKHYVYFFFLFFPSRNPFFTPPAKAVLLSFSRSSCFRRSAAAFSAASAFSFAICSGLL